MTGAHPYIKHLSKDKKLRKIILMQEPAVIKRKKNVPLQLCASIMSQQLSTKVAAVIYRRFLDVYGKNEPTPEQIAGTPNEILRAIGLSNAKVQYVKNVANFAIANRMDSRYLNKLTNEEVIEYLVPIKGVGRWTVEMLLMFTLGREDVFAADDLGIQNAMIKLYDLTRDNKKQLRESMIRISANWSPYQSFACMHLWRWKDNGPV